MKRQVSRPDHLRSTITTSIDNPIRIDGMEWNEGVVTLQFMSNAVSLLQLKPIMYYV